MCKMEQRSRACCNLRTKISEGTEYNLGVGIAQQWERSPPTNVSRVQFPPDTVCELSLLLVLALLQEFSFLQLLRFSSLHKSQPRQTPIRAEQRIRMPPDVISYRLRISGHFMVRQTTFPEFDRGSGTRFALGFFSLTRHGVVRALRRPPKIAK